MGDVRLSRFGTLRRIRRMSAVPPKGDIAEVRRDVR